MKQGLLNCSSYGIIQRLYELEERFLVFFLSIVFIWQAVLPSLPELPTQWHGLWLDEAVSRTLSQKYEMPITVRNVRFLGWFHIRCDALTASSPSTGSLLLESGSAAITLLRMPSFQSPQVESRIDFKELKLHKAYYQNQNLPNPWSTWLKKPIPIRHLQIHVLQDESKMKVSIVGCEADGVKMGGFVEYFKSGKIVDKINFDLSKWRFVKLAV